jgi:hypothetical protein
MNRVRGAVRTRWPPMIAVVVATTVLAAGGIALAQSPQPQSPADTGRATTYFARLSDDGTTAAVP